jgi:predicted phosphodiesterase
VRVALISDLHANEIALDAVLRDAAGAGHDALVCLGDVATLGPRPAEVLARLRGLGCRTVMGNHDAFMLDPSLIRSYSESALIVGSVEATRAALSSADLAFIQTFEPTIALEGLLLYHGTPRSNTEDLLATTPPERVDEMLAGVQATVLAGGHTHLQMLRQHRGMLIVNTGSLGMPFREYAAGGPPVILPFAEYALVESGRAGVSVDLRRVPLEPRALAAQVDGWDNPLAPALRASYAA